MEAALKRRVSFWQNDDGAGNMLSVREFNAIMMKLQVPVSTKMTSLSYQLGSNVRCSCGLKEWFHQHRGIPAQSSDLRRAGIWNTAAPHIVPCKTPANAWRLSRCYRNYPGLSYIHVLSSYLNQSVEYTVDSNSILLQLIPSQYFRQYSPSNRSV